MQESLRDQFLSFETMPSISKDLAIVPPPLTVQPYPWGPILIPNAARGRSPIGVFHPLVRSRWSLVNMRARRAHPTE